MKRLFSILMCLVLLATSTAFASTSYTVTVDGNGGPMTVVVEMDGDVIVDVKVTEHHETAGIGDSAIDSLPAEIVKQQSTLVDTVAGATITSKAILAAVEEVVAKSSADVNVSEKSAEIENESPNKEKSSKPSTFTNKFGTANTKCAVAGCTNYIASSGDTNCCSTHSNHCGICGQYCDGVYCYSCLVDLAKALGYM